MFFQGPLWLSTGLSMGNGAWPGMSSRRIIIANLLLDSGAMKCARLYAGLERPANVKAMFLRATAECLARISYSPSVYLCVYVTLLSSYGRRNQLLFRYSKIRHHDGQVGCVYFCSRFFFDLIWIFLSYSCKFYTGLLVAFVCIVAQVFLIVLLSSFAVL